MEEHVVHTHLIEMDNNMRLWAQLEPIVLTQEQAKEFKQHIDTICKKHGIEYLERHYRNLLDSDAKIYQGERHDSMMKYRK